MSSDGPARPPRLRIGELAELAGTTARAVRHYHSIGLLEEPARDGSGYRRYGPDDLVRLVRIRRLRALGLPLEQVAADLSSADPHVDLEASLRALAEDIGRQIEDLRALRQRVLDVASTKGAAPAETWQAALRAHGLFDGGGTLPRAEHAAVDLLDVLHPDGVAGVLEQSSELLSDPTLVRRLSPLLERFRELPEDEAAIEQLAREVAALLPRPERTAPPVDVATMDRLVGDRFSEAQRRFLHRLRRLLEAGDG